MNEIEVKIIDIDCLEIEERIHTLNGKLIKDEFQENYIFSLPKGLNENGYIRIRKTEDFLDSSTKVLLCIKKVIFQGEFREMEEKEFEVSDFEEAFGFLDMLHFEFLRQENKKRKSYLLNNSLIEFDTWDDSVFPKPYIEIEAKNEKDLFDTLSLLNIDKDKITSKGLLEIKKEMGLI